MKLDTQEGRQELRRRQSALHELQNNPKLRLKSSMAWRAMHLIIESFPLDDGRIYEILELYRNDVANILVAIRNPEVSQALTLKRDFIARFTDIASEFADVENDERQSEELPARFLLDNKIDYQTRVRLYRKWLAILDYIELLNDWWNSLEMKQTNEWVRRVHNINTLTYLVNICYLALELHNAGVTPKKLPTIQRRQVAYMDKIWNMKQSSFRAFLGELYESILDEIAHGNLANDANMSRFLIEVSRACEKKHTKKKPATLI